jgi:AmmeMemoRadiSam system protein A
MLSKMQQQQLLEIARQALVCRLQNKPLPKFSPQDSALQQKLGAFVTLKNHGQLRGCIGCFNPDKPLYQVVQEKVVDAGINDPRFYPVDVDELKNLSIEISVLSPNIKIDDWRKIKLGKHGVVVQKGSRGGTFLPQVATETGWDLETFLSNLCTHKAGLPADSYKDPRTDIYVFTAQIFGE